MSQLKVVGWPGQHKRLLGTQLPSTTALWLVVAVLFACPQQAVHAQAPLSSLHLLGVSRLTLDPLCNARSGARLDASLRNDGTSSTRLSMSAGEPVNKVAGKVAFVTVNVTPVDDKGEPLKGMMLLAPTEIVRVRIELLGTLDTGEWDVEIRNEGVSVGTLTVVSPQIGYGVKIDTSSDNPEITFFHGKPATISLRNEDSLGYHVSGKYSVRGVIQKGQEEIFLPANGGGELGLMPPQEWFAPGFRTLFKDDSADGRLTLRFSSDACRSDAATQVRVINVKTILAPWSPDWRDFLSNSTLLIVLVLGSLCSLALNFFLPGNARRIRARTQLSLVAQRIDDITVEADSRVRSSLAVEQRQLKDRLLRIKFDGQFNSEMIEIERSLARLGTRLDLVRQLQLVLNRYWQQRWVIVSDEIEVLRTQLGNLLRQNDPADSEILLMQSLIKKIDDRLTNANAVNPDLASRLAKHVALLKTEFDPQGKSVGASPVWLRLHPKLAEEWVAVNAASVAVSQIEPTDYVRLARAVFVLEQIRSVIPLCEVKNDRDLTQEDEAHLVVLLQRIRAGGWDNLKRAERLVRQMRQRIFYEQFEAEIEQNRVIIEPNRPVVRQYEPTELRITFLNRIINSSAAREEYTCNWEIKYAERKVNLTSGGWSVSHSFPFFTAPDIHPSEPDGRVRRFLKRVFPEGWFSSKEDATPTNKSFEVSVTFVRDDGKRVSSPVTASVEVQPPLPVRIRASTWNELLQLGLALGVAIIGLVVGAREQILKLDVFPALIAVFLLGFASDRVKSVFAQNPPPTVDPKPVKAGEAAGAT